MRYICTISLLAALFLSWLPSTIIACDPAQYELCIAACRAEWEPKIALAEAKLAAARAKIDSIVVQVEATIAQGDAEMLRHEAKGLAIRSALLAALYGCGKLATPILIGECAAAAQLAAIVALNVNWRISMRT